MDPSEIHRNSIKSKALFGRQFIPMRISAKFLFLFLVFAASIQSLLAFASKTEEQKTNYKYEIYILNRFDQPNRLTNPVRSVKDQEAYVSDWYSEFDPKEHFSHLKMPFTERQIEIFLDSNKSNFAQDEVYRNLLTEIIIRSSMMFRLANYGFTLSYTKELEKIFHRLADLDKLLNSFDLSFEERNEELSRIFSFALNVGIQEVKQESLRAEASIKEVLNTIVDFSHRPEYGKSARKAYNKERYSERFVRRILVALIVHAFVLFTPDVLDLDSILDLPKSYKFLGNSICTAIICYPIFRKFILPDFRKSQNHIFSLAGASCSNLLKENEASVKGIPGIRR
ncbi:MAG: hypothetical protein KDD35_05715 [Bdellovibrionales bacterium]|nr:hypothetical protein [Bdellovibrionales bacterium]